ncbi:MAG TPA: hypothetical protein VEK07_21560 [Polyangiaceae bacterium]|nr:hypothetical protein [Polyangiaceae bacterium]
MTAAERDRCVAAWSAADADCAVLPADRRVIEHTAAVRGLIVELAAPGMATDELFDACAVLGRLVAQHGGSPTLAALTIDHAAAALGDPNSSWKSAARAAVLEGFAAALMDSIRREANEAWEFPRCVVAVGDRAIAVAAGYPGEDDQEIAAWVDRVAKGAALQGTKTAFVSGPEAVRARLIDALSVAGILVKP